MALDTYSLLTRFDVGPKELPTVLTTEVSSDARLTGLSIVNQGAGTATVTVQDGNNFVFYKKAMLVGDSVYFDDREGFLQNGGIKWSSSIAGVHGYMKGKKL